MFFAPLAACVMEFSLYRGQAAIPQIYPGPIGFVGRY